MKKIAILLLSVFALASCVERAEIDIINPDADFLYFYWATCPHCQDLNAQIEEADLFSKISVEKREVYFNKVNSGLFNETAKKAGLKQHQIAVPFVYDKATGNYAIWVDDAIDLFNTRIWGVVPEVTTTWSTQ